MIVVNTSPLVALERLGRLNLLSTLFQELTRPQSVFDELMTGRSRYGVSEQLFRAEWIKTFPDPPEASFRPELGKGETAAIALAVQQKADLILLDDLAARNVAKEMELEVSGTLGVLIAGYRQNLLNDIDQALEQPKASGFHMSDTLIQHVKNQTM